jgi:nitroreductase
MDLYEAIKGRRSIRRFKPDPVPKGVLDRIFEMATWAPSGMNLQNWHFVVVTGERKEALVKLASKGYDYIEPVLREVFALLRACPGKARNECPERGRSHSKSFVGRLRRGIGYLLDDRPSACGGPDQ